MKLPVGVSRLVQLGLLLSTYLFVASLSLSAQPSLEAGTPFLSYYSLKEQQLHPENWALTTDRRGLLYVANVEGVLEHDGHTWRAIPVEGRRVRSLATTADGTVYVGGEGAFGKLVPDSVGFLEFRSLRDQLPEKVRDFANVFQLFAIGNEVYLNTGNHLIKVGPSGTKVWDASFPDAFHTAFGVNGQVYVRENGVGLRVVKEDKLETIEGGQAFGSMNERIDAIVPYNERRVLIATRNVGLYLYDEQLGLQPLPSEATGRFAEDQLYSGAALPNGEFAFGTLRGGVIILDRMGRVVRVIDRAEGLPAAKVYAIMPDAQGSMWLALDRGLAHVEYPAAITRFGEARGLEGTAVAVARHEGRVVAATSTGVFRLEPGQRASFTPLAGLRAQAWHLAQAQGSLLVGASQGVFQLQGGQLKPIANNDDRIAAFYLMPARHNPDRIYVGTFYGVSLVEKTPRGWAMAGALPKVEKQINWIVESPAPGPGGSVALWMGNATDGVLRVLLYSNAEPQVESFTEEDGLPSNAGVRAAVVNGEVVFTTPDGLYSYDEPTRRFAPAEPLGGELGRQRRDVKWLMPAPDGTTWAYTYSAAEGARLWQIKGFAANARALRTPLGRVSRYAAPRAMADGTAEGSALWLATDEGLLRYDPAVKKPYLTSYRAAVRSVLPLVDSTGRATVYMGASADTAASVSLSAEVDYAYNGLRFSVAAPSYDDALSTEYQYRLDPVEDAWGRWTNETYRDYTNLSEGTYTFRVRARNSYGNVSAEHQVRFTVAPPWYRTWYFILLWVVILLAVLYGFLRWRIAQLEADKRLLEQKVQERTAEVMRQKAELENAYEEIRATNEQLEEAFKEIETKNRDITDSIQYAKRIQEAILPPDAEIADALPDAFVLYKPRDIVSGDFYWLHRTDGLTYVAAVDCTGHGVPGAFMSVMGNSLLNEIVGQAGLRDPGEILTRLDARVQQTLRQMGGQSKSKDGMEVALLCLDPANGEVRFAGANRPLIYIRSGSADEVAPDKVPIGGHAYTHIERYTTTTLRLAKGDCLYAFSDGYGDQFGGDKGRKFMVKNLKDMILRIHNQPMPEQRVTLGDTIDQWRGSRPQIDDILVIGVRM